jgi:hypothetical protein
VEDHHVDRPDVEARRRVKLTGTNRSFDLIALVAKAREALFDFTSAEKALVKNREPKTQFCFIPFLAGLVALARR